VRTIYASDNTPRSCYRTRHEVEKHLAIGGPATLRSKDQSPRATPSHSSAATTFARPKAAPAGFRIVAQAPKKAMRPEPAVISRSGRTVKKSRPLEAPGALGEAQSVHHERFSSSMTLYLQPTPRTLPQSSPRAKKQRNNNNGNGRRSPTSSTRAVAPKETLRWTAGHKSISIKDNGAVRDPQRLRTPSLVPLCRP
jgi:hypothetical protein